MGYPVVHFEIAAADGTALGRYYAELFGWEVTPMEGAQYALIDTRSAEGIQGGIATTDGKTGVMVYVAVPNIEDAVEKFVSLGGAQLTDIIAMPGVVTFAQMADPQGNPVGLVLDDGEAPATSGDGAGVGWFEFLGTDGPALRAFYGEAFGWKFKVSTGDGFDYGEVDTGADGRGIPGGVGTSRSEPVTTVYASVDDVTKYLERAEALGGSRIHDPIDVGSGTTIGVFRDAAGNAFGLFQHVHPHD